MAGAPVGTVKQDAGQMVAWKLHILEQIEQARAELSDAEVEGMAIVIIRNPSSGYESNCRWSAICPSEIMMAALQMWSATGADDARSINPVQ
jgi:hypothetical protein